MESRTISFYGKVPKLKENDATRLAAYVLRGREVLAKAPLQADGSFRVSVARAVVSTRSAYALNLAIAPAGAGDHLEHVPHIQQVPMNREHLEKADKEFAVPVEKLLISDAVLRIWWRWCRLYCVSGVVL